ncbi:unnamed protein product [marine sediment metagenome]|uniref:RiboL-PSP-HEPN domain-containing protein n=1 Tax=marine sediment metagenome TaxID=412755 RepID=X1AQQ7_9ZZZZ
MKSNILMQEYLQKQINLVAETHFLLRPQLIQALKNQIITDEGKKFIGNFNNYYEYWEKSFSDRFFDMGTFIRLGSVIENNLKHYYMNKKGHNNLTDLNNDPNYSLNIFQRVQSWQTNGVIPLYQNELGVDLTANINLTNIQEIMMHRHLYAHNSGILNDDYIEKLKRINGTDLLSDPNVIATYPYQDHYWFQPLEKLNSFIEETRRFFRQFT